MLLEAFRVHEYKYQASLDFSYDQVTGEGPCSNSRSTM